MSDVAHVRGPVAWSPDGRWVASAGRVIEVWSAADGQLAFRLYGHMGTVNALAWHPHGNRLASAAEEHTIKIWDVDTRQEILTLHGNTAWAAASMAWSPDGTRLAAVNGDEVRIWDASVGYRMVAGPEYRFDRACRLTAQGRNDEARVILGQLVTEHPEVPEYRSALARCLNATGRVREAEALLKQPAGTKKPKPAPQGKDK
jgi:WD40 repeat protein